MQVGAADQGALDQLWRLAEQCHDHLRPERNPDHVRLALVGALANKLGNSISAVLDRERLFSQAAPVLRQVGHQAVIVLKCPHLRLPHPAGHAASVQEDEAGRIAGSAFGDVQAHLLLFASRRRSRLVPTTSASDKSPRTIAAL